MTFQETLLAAVREAMARRAGCEPERVEHVLPSSIKDDASRERFVLYRDLYYAVSSFDA